MAFLVGGANTLDSSYEIENSLRFNEDDSAYLSKTWGSEGSKRTMTFSFWFKRGEFGDERYNVYAAGADANNRDTIATMDESFDLILQRNDTTYYRLRTNRLFRDPSAWYHMVIAIDTTDGTASNRFKMYVNGVQETSFATSDYPTQNLDLYFNDDIAQYIGRFSTSDINHWDGHMADFYFIDGTQYAASDFGETNDNGVWVPKKFAGTFGSNGFKLEFKQTGTSQNSSGIGADTSGNDNHFAVTNLAAVDITTDTPTNNFATLNPLGGITGTGGGTFSEGNCKYVTSGTDSTGALSTIPVGGNLATGKWYCEFKAISKTGNYYNYGVSNVPTGIFSGGGGIHSIIYRSDGKIYLNGNQSETSLTSLSDNDIVGMAYNGDLGKLQFYINGSTVGGLKSIPNTGFEVFFCSASNGGSTQTTEINFGNAPFSISSGNADANGYGNFEYAVPSGYYALCTKNLAEYG